MKALISVGLEIGTERYDINVAIPGNNPTVENPYIFKVVQTIEGQDSSNLLDIKIVDSSNYLVDVVPPESILELVPVVKDVSVVISDGVFDTPVDPEDS
jgi:hypothetical protein